MGNLRDAPVIILAQNRRRTGDVEVVLRAPDGGLVRYLVAGEHWHEGTLAALKARLTNHP